MNLVLVVLGGLGGPFVYIMSSMSLVVYAHFVMLQVKFNIYDGMVICSKVLILELTFMVPKCQVLWCDLRSSAS